MSEPYPDWAKLPTLIDWCKDHVPNDNLIWKEGLGDQVRFVQRRVHPMFWTRGPGGYAEDAMRHIDESRANLRVVSSHHSKSVELPVFLMWLPELNILACLRYNFYNWKVSIHSEKPIVALVHKNLFDPTVTHPSCYCEGFPENLLFGSYSSNQNRFTVELGSDYCVYTFFWQIKNHVFEVVRSK